MQVVATADSQSALRAAAPLDVAPNSSVKTKRTISSGAWTKPPHELASVPTRRGHLGAVREFGRLVARSDAMHDVFDVLDRFARTDVTITLSGETGVGKDIIARELHDQSLRREGPMVVFDCGSVASNLVESELLGHERGAFTGAMVAHAGAFERAHGGTLFLDEIGELPLDLQPRLLRALENRRVRRVGGRIDRRVDVRVVAATNRDLRADVAAGRFREDLYFRLAVAVVSVPPLRRRLDDLPQLVHGLLADLGHETLRASDSALTTLRAHAWPGNIRELKNALACAAAFLETGALTLEPKHLRLLAAIRDECFSLEGLPLAGQALDSIERVAIRQTLAQADGNKMLAARTLGIAVSTLYEKLKKYGL